MHCPSRLDYPAQHAGGELCSLGNWNTFRDEYPCPLHPPVDGIQGMSSILKNLFNHSFLQVKLLSVHSFQLVLLAKVEQRSFNSEL